MAHYDHIVIGAGLSGLLLADALSLAGLGRILLVDRRLDTDGSTTLAYWTDRPVVLDEWSLRTWDSIAVIHRTGRTAVLPLRGMRYTAVSWDSARHDLLARVRRRPQVRVVEGEVRDVVSGADGVHVSVDGSGHTGRWAYDSRPVYELAELQPADQQVVQAFTGAWIEVPDPGHDDAAAVLMDLRGPGDLGFTYALPVSAHRILVMRVAMGRGARQPVPPDAAWAGGGTVVGVEQGRTLLASPFPGRDGRVLRIGLRGGRARPSTGFAASRIMADTTAIVTSLSTRGHPFDLPAEPRWQRYLDRVWLQTLTDTGAVMKDAFEALFDAVPAESLLRFLDGSASRGDVTRVVRALPPGPFVRAAARDGFVRLMRR